MDIESIALAARLRLVLVSTLLAARLRLNSLPGLCGDSICVWGEL